MQIRSYARAFPTDRRIYRIDRWAIPVPGGLPLAASAWFLALAIVVWAIGQLPGAGTVIEVVGWPAAVIVAPGAGALALTRRCDDGRTLPRLTIHHAAFELRTRCVRRHLPAALPAMIRVAGDATLSGRAIVHGPGRLTLPPWSDITVARNGRVTIQATASNALPAGGVLQLAVDEFVEARA